MVTIHLLRVLSPSCRSTKGALPDSVMRVGRLQIGENRKLARMELLEGLPLLLQQFNALFHKNFLLSWRSKRSTILQLFSSVLFIFLIFCLQKAMDLRYASSSSVKDERNPESLVAPPIPPCEDNFHIILPCFDFVFSGNSKRIGQIVESIRRNNPGRRIPETKVKAFKTPKETDDWLASNPLRTPAALHFVDRNTTVISYGLQTNSTGVPRHFEVPTFKFQIPLQLAAEREIARFLIGDVGFTWIVSLKQFPHPAFDEKHFSAIKAAGPTFFLAVAMFPFVFQISTLVTEKELKLRQAMTIMGLYDTAYWLSWLSWQGIIMLLSSLFTVLFGMMFQFDFFKHNNFAVVFLLFFLFQLNMTGFGFMLSAFVSKSSSSTSIGFFTFIIGFMTQLVTASGFPYNREFSKTNRILWSLFPPNLFARGLILLSKATATTKDPGISWSGRIKCARDDLQCFLTINGIYKWLAFTLCLWLILAIYFDNILPNTSGVRKPMLYFLNPWYWTGKGGNKYEEGSICSCGSSIPPIEEIAPDDVDVQEEESIVKQQAQEGDADSSIAAQIHGLVKIYAETTRIGCCCRRKRTAPYLAVKGLWLSFPKDQLFCLLGPNGAGKTTTISCLIGITPATSGDALIYGHSIQNPSGMANIRKIIGVCPQFDTLWASLTGEEHLQLFAWIKGLHPHLVNPVVQKLLAEVRLTDSAKTRAGSYSGGMRRCISVAIALIGDPRLLILDEPTSGMDPITRRHVWDVIRRAKNGRAIILTTHSMEEADILGDKIGIMAKGRLRCIGTSVRLKSRFGTGFVSNISFSSDTYNTAQHTAVKEFFQTRLNISPKEESKSFLTFIIPHEKEKLLKNFFSELEKRAMEFGISDIQFSLTTLEEVFLNIAKQAELESAAAEGKFETLALNSGLSYQVLVGARYVGLPGTESEEYPRGNMVEVYWQQDDSGNLCIAGHSKEVLVPDHVQLQTPSTTISRRNISSQQRHGMVIDPSQIDESIFYE